LFGNGTGVEGIASVPNYGIDGIEVEFRQLGQCPVYSPRKK
jgi:hypothetical protein